jgi:hypothetical protein
VSDTDGSASPAWAKIGSSAPVARTTTVGSGGAGAVVVVGVALGATVVVVGVVVVVVVTGGAVVVVGDALAAVLESACGCGSSGGSVVDGSVGAGNAVDPSLADGVV